MVKPLIALLFQEGKTPNIAREASLGANVPLSVPAHTVSMACISSNQSIASGIMKREIFMVKIKT